MNENFIKSDKKNQDEFLSEKDSESERADSLININKGKPKLIFKEDDMFSRKLSNFNNKMKEINKLYYTSESKSKLQRSIDLLKKDNLDYKARSNFRTIEHSRHPSYISGTTKSKFDSLVIEHDSKTERYQTLSSTIKNKSSLIKNSSSFLTNKSQQGVTDKKNLKSNLLKNNNNSKSPRNSTLLSGPYMSNIIESKRLSKNDVVPSLRRKARVYQQIESSLLSFKGVPKNLKLTQALTKDEDAGMDQLTNNMLKDIGKKLGFAKKPNTRPKLKTNTFNKFLINDFSIGEKTNAIENSKSKEEQQYKKLKKLTNLMDYGSSNLESIAEDMSSDSLDFDYPEIDLISKYKPLNLLEITKNNNYMELKKAKEQVEKEEIKKRSEKLVNMILEIDNEYEPIIVDPDVKINKTLYVKNLERTIRLRNILKHKADPEESLGMADLKKYREDRNNIAYLTSKSMNKLDLPSFIKKNFRMSTMQKYKIVNGNYFGVPC